IARYVPAFQAACGKGIADACAGVGMAELDGAGLARDQPKALRDLEAACDAGSSAGCAKGSEFVLRTEHDHSVLEKRFMKMVARCEKLGGSVCFSLAWAYEKGFGTNPDSAKGSAMAKRACDTGSSYACLDVAQDLAEAGKTAEAKTLLLKACDGDIEQGCALAAAMTKPADGPEARKLLTRGCALGMPQPSHALPANH